MESKPPAAVVVCISKCERHDLGRSAVLDQNVILTREGGKFGLYTETGRVDLRAGINPASKKAFPMHRLYCGSGVLRALASLRVYLPVRPHGKTWLPSARLQTG